MGQNIFRANNEKIANAFYAVMPLTFFFPVKIFNVFIVAFFFFWLFLYQRDRYEKSDWKGFYLLTIPIFICIYGLIIDWRGGMLPESLDVFETFLPILFFAVLTLVYVPDPAKVQLTKISFYISCIMAAISCLAVALYKNATDHERMVHNWNFIETMQFYENYPIGLINWGFFLYKEFSEPIGFHPVYLSMYFILGIIFGMSFLSLPIPRYIKIPVVLGIVLLFLQIFLLNSKAAILAAVVVIALQAIPVFLRRSSARSKKIAVSLTLIILIVVPLLFPIVIYRIKSGVYATIALIRNEDSETQDSNRVQIWRTTTALIENNPFKGYGLFGSRRVLEESYQEQGLRYYNTHNQYLMFMLAAGAGGFLLFLINQGALLFIAIKSRNFHYVLFLVVLVIVMLTENILNRHKGVILYGYFNAVFLLQCLLFSNSSALKQK